MSICDVGKPEIILWFRWGLNPGPSAYKADDHYIMEPFADSLTYTYTIQSMQISYDRQ